MLFVHFLFVLFVIISLLIIIVYNNRSWPVMMDFLLTGSVPLFE